MGKVLVLTALVMILSAVFGIGLARYGCDLPFIRPFFEESCETPILTGTQDLNQLTTARLTGQVVVTEEAEPGRIQNLADFVGVDTSALTGESVILVATGEVEAGVNLDNLEDRDVRVGEDTVTINLPDAEILSSSLDEERTGLYDRNRGFFVYGVNDEIADEARRECCR